MPLLAETLPKTSSSYLIAHKPAKNGYIMKTGYKVPLSAEEVVDIIILHCAANPGNHLGYKVQPYNGVSIFTSDTGSDQSTWEEFFGVKITKLPSAA